MTAPEGVQEESATSGRLTEIIDRLAELEDRMKTIEEQAIELEARITQAEQ